MRGNWLGLRCLLKLCPGKVDYDNGSTFWQCSICGKKDEIVKQSNRCEVDGCGEHSLIYLNGREQLCWEHYTDRIRAIREADSGK